MKIITQNNEFEIKSWLCHDSKSSFFTSLITSKKSGNKQLTSNRFIDSRNLSLKEICEKNLEKFHDEAVIFFKNKFKIKF